MYHHNLRLGVLRILRRRKIDRASDIHTFCFQSLFRKESGVRVLVLHDELDLLPGTARLKIGGGTGGHNGLKSIVSCLGNSQNFCRLRIGIGKPAGHGEVINFVLGAPAPAEKKLIDAALNEALECIEIIFNQNLARATNRLNSFKASKE